ncbi:DNA primase [Candidatus Saccharibacteria bacterium]|nr:DNA primase [Candidatus Saccharibacteria bacterium]
MEEAKEEVRARLAIEDVVGQYIELKRAGRNFKGRSPWGVDKTPSFMVSPEKGIWHDFSSNKGGDIFSFIMEMEGIDFREALEKLAQQAGVEMNKYNGGDKKVLAQKKRMKEALELACRYFQFCLTKNKTVCDYVFYKRNLNKDTVKEFRIGYAPKSGRALVEFLKNKGFSKEEISDAGLTNRFGGDLFKGRMIIPLMDTVGTVIGFTGRILDDSDKNAPKYLNTPETLLFNKGRHVFGFSQAKEAIRKNDFIVVVEGNMDVISSHQAGVKQAVATAGTAMTEMHLKSFVRITRDIRLAYDGDEAGIKAAERAIGLASKLGIYLSVIDDYRGCKDADELIQKDPLLWQKAIEAYIPAIEWLLSKYEEKYDLRTERGFREYAQVAKRLIDQIDVNDTALREKYEQLVAQKLGISLEAFHNMKIEGSSVKRILKGKKNLKKVRESAAGKYLAAILNYSKADLGFLNNIPELKKAGIGLDDLLGGNFNKDELELIFEEKYKSTTDDALKQEAKELVLKTLKEWKQERQEDIQRKISEAEEAGNDREVERLLEETKKYR